MSTGQASPPALVNSLKTTLLARQADIQQLLGTTMSANRLIKIANMAVYKSGDLQKCKVTSIIACVEKAATYRLDLEPSAMECYLIPRWNKHRDGKNQGGHECTFQLGYQGIKKLVLRGGNVRAFDIRTVYANEPFSLMYTPELRFRHEPIMNEAERGDIIGIYGYGRMRGGEPFITYMTVNEINEHAKKYGGATWNSDWLAMATKTVVIAHAKKFPKNSEELISAMADDYDAQGFEPFDNAPKNTRKLGNEGLRERIGIGQTKETEVLDPEVETDVDPNGKATDDELDELASEE